MTDVVQIDATLLHVEFVKDAVVACSQLEFGSALKSLVGEFANREPMSSTLSWIAARTVAGRESNALENVGDQIWSAAPTNYFGWRVVY